MKALFIAFIIGIIISCTIVQNADDIDSFDFVGYFVGMQK